MAHISSSLVWKWPPQEDLTVDHHTVVVVDVDVDDDDIVRSKCSEPKVLSVAVYFGTLTNHLKLG